MGKDTPYITEGDGEADIESSLIRACGINNEDYAEDESILTREVLESHLNELLRIVHKINDHVAYLILGVLILNTGSEMPEDFRDILNESADCKIDREKYIGKITEDEEFFELRKNILIDFQEKVRNYKPGQIIDVW